jgi:hypothetical protein
MPVFNKSGKSWKGGLKTLALDTLALHFAGAAHGLRGFARAALGGFFVVPAEFHFAEHAFALELLFKRFQRLIDVIVTNENLHLAGNPSKKEKHENGPGG